MLYIYHNWFVSDIVIKSGNKLYTKKENSDFNPSTSIPTNYTTITCVLSSGEDFYVAATAHYSHNKQSIYFVRKDNGEPLELGKPEFWQKADMLKKFDLLLIKLPSSLKRHASQDFTVDNRLVKVTGFQDIESLYDGMPVCMVGATSGPLDGTISDPHFDCLRPSSAAEDTEAFCTENPVAPLNTIIVQMNSAPGDRGALLFTKPNQNTGECKAIAAVFGEWNDRGRQAKAKEILAIPFHHQLQIIQTEFDLELLF